jgi:hypothetical protein
VCMHVSSITCSSSGGATQTALGTLRAYNVNILKFLQPEDDSLTFRNRASYIRIGQAHRYPTNTPFYVFFQQIYVLNFLNMLHTLNFFLFKMPFIS